MIEHELITYEEHYEKETHITLSNKAKQKILGASMILASVLCILLVQDGTVPVFLAPLGLYVLFTKEDLYEKENY